MPYILSMTGNEFIKRAKRYGKDRGLAVEFVARRGKGSHGRLYVGDRFTTMKDRKKEIGPGLLNKMLADLNIDPSEF